MRFWAYLLLITFPMMSLGPLIAQAVIMPMDSEEFFSNFLEQSQMPETSETYPLSNIPREEPPPPVRTEAVTPEKQEEWHITRSKILDDFSGRLNEDFKVPSALRRRTEFWFDIYTRYGEAHHIVHHILYPWIVFKVVDTTETLQNGKGPTWLRRDRASKLAKQQAANIRAALRSLAKRKNYAKLPALERELYDKLVEIKGPRRQVLAQAAQSVRTQLGQKDFFERGLVNSSRYLPYMEAQFEKMGLPTELTRMPFVESSFNENAESKVGASGIWQIMPRTGRAYMIVNDRIDERNSPLKATAIAARLLRDYHKAMDSWPLAITSYNHGIGNIQKAIKAAKSRDLATIIKRYHKGDFQFASSNFFTCFLAALHAEKYHELLFKEIPREPLQEHEVIKLTGRTGVRHLRKLTGLDTEQLLKYNLDLRKAIQGNTFLPRGFEIYLPPGFKGKVSRQLGVQEKRSKPRT